MEEKIKNILYSIKEQPGIYIGEKSLERLAMYITGYISCMIELTNETTDFLINIQNYITNYYNVESVEYWVDIMKRYTLSEEDAYDKFYELLDAFLGWDTEGRFSCVSADN